MVKYCDSVKYSLLCNVARDNCSGETNPKYDLVW